MLAGTTKPNNTTQGTKNRNIDMSERPRITGPASYFPSIEKKYGQPIEHWLNLLKSLKGMKHMEMVKWLKTEHGMGHGHANALVGYLRAHP